MQQYTIEGVVVMIEASGGGGRQCLHRWQQDLVGGGRNNQRNEERENEREKETEGRRGWNVVRLVADGDEWRWWMERMGVVGMVLVREEKGKKNDAPQKNGSAA